MGTFIELTGISFLCCMFRASPWILAAANERVHQHVQLPEGDKRDDDRPSGKWVSWFPLSVGTAFLFSRRRGDGDFFWLPGADPSSTNTTTDTANDKEDYCRPRPLSEAYSVPPAARPITSLILPGHLPVTPSPTTPNPIEANYSIVPAPTPVVASPLTPTATMTMPNGLELPLQGYMKMYPAGKWFPRNRDLLI